MLPKRRPNRQGHQQEYANSRQQEALVRRRYPEQVVELLALVLAGQSLLKEVFPEHGVVMLGPAGAGRQNTKPELGFLTC